MGLHKLTAGDGYTYLTRQVAAHDSTERGARGLGDYYSERGESPGRWMGNGLAGLGITAGAAVSEDQMRSLFGAGRHPDAEQLGRAVAATEGTPQAAVAAGALGRAFPVYDACARFQVAVARQFTRFNTDRGVAWNAPIPLDQRAGIRSAVATRMFADEHGRPPTDARELAGYVAKASRQATTAVAGYDLTFSPVKSVSTLWALAPPDVATTVRDAHDAAVADTIAWLEREAAFTRIGRAGVRQVSVRGLVCASFTHRDSRAGDPDLHTHVAVSNKVQTDDGRWLALDGRVLYHAKVAASERYNTRLEAELVARLGVRFEDRDTHADPHPDHHRDRRPVREMAGVNPLLTRWWSSRRADIETRRTTLSSQFQQAHGRPPTAVEALALAQQATLETRQAKHDPRSEPDQRTAWRAEADKVLAGAAEVDHMLTATLSGRAETTRLSAGWVMEAAATVIARLEQDRATWQVWHVRAQAERQARAAGIALGEHDRAVDQTVAYALDQLSTRLGAADPVPDPVALRRPNGESCYDVHGTTRYTSARVLAAEQRLLQVAAATGAPTISGVRVGVAIAEAAANGVDLNDAQTGMVHQLATSGRRLHLALAPAGTGKTTTMRVLARAWTDAGGDVLGLAPSAQAAHELDHALTSHLSGHTDTLAKLTWTLTRTPHDEWPEWVRQIGPRTLVIVDEAGQAGTTDLDVAVDHLVRRGATVRLVGDDQQLAAIGAGGLLRDIQHTHGAVTLSQVARFTDPAEAAVTLAVRDGDTAALGFYADHGRIHVGDTGSACDQAYHAWAADQRAGLDSVLLAPTRELVTQLNVRARADRLDNSPVPADVQLGDGTRASAGDTVVTRRNDRRLVVSGSDWVKNGDRWTVRTVHGDGSITVAHRDHRRSVTLPADYVAEHVQLGYAVTVHCAQGVTTDTAHVVLTGQESRQLLYVALSRGRSANHLYLTDGHDGDPHSLIRRDTLLPPTAIDVLAATLRRDGSQQSATSTRREAESPTVMLHQAATRYADALTVAAEQVLGERRLVDLERQIEAIWTGLTTEAAYPTMRGRLVLEQLDGHDPLTVLLDASTGRGLGTAEDRAAVLDWRIRQRPGTGPLPWLTTVPTPVRQHPDWGPYLEARAARVTTLAEQVRSVAHRWSLPNSPAWAAGLSTCRDVELSGDLAVWRAAFAVPDADYRPTGARQVGTDVAEHQRQLDRRIRATTTGATGALATDVTATAATSRSWRDLLPPVVTSDPAARSLYDKLDSLNTAAVPVDTLVSQALAHPRPLPDQCAADALWWRVVCHLGPAALHASYGSGATLRPDWTPILVELFGPETAERVMADSAWPALVAAVRARPSEWSSDQLLTTAAGQGAHRTPAEDLCSALVWRVATLTDPPPDDDPDQLPPDPASLADEPPADMGLAAPAVAAVDHPGTPRERIIELNRAALDVYTQAYPKSWAPAYLRDRLGTDLADDSPFTIGYAPPGPTSLVRHLSGLGATDTEIIDAGLARLTERGRLVDTFRDRLVFPIHHEEDLVGFITRRNPVKDDQDYAGPKYLNTRTTAAFTKGEQLFGLPEERDRLAAGATPVLVEGPLDAIAITHATNGRYVGIAPLGTAFTAAQALQLRAQFRHEASNIVIATDADPAGWAAAQRAFWRLAQYGADPRHLNLPAGLDPADALREDGAPAVERALEHTRPFAESLLTSIIEPEQEDLDAPATRLRLVRQTAQVIGALPPEQWLHHIEHTTERLHLPAGMLHLELVDAGDQWTNDPTQTAAQRVAESHLRQAASEWPESTENLATLGDRFTRPDPEQLTARKHVPRHATAPPHEPAGGRPARPVLPSPPPR